VVNKIISGNQALEFGHFNYASNNYVESSYKGFLKYLGRECGIFIKVVVVRWDAIH
jgi:hypothetical protein